jgi:hypothetical protein
MSTVLLRAATPKMTADDPEALRRTGTRRNESPAALHH